jgi:hypothetical protein
MTRPLVSRVLSLTLMLWLSLFTSESELIVRCQTHGGGLDSQVAVSHSATADTPADGHVHGGGDSTPADQDTGHSCSCPGPGCCPPAVAVVPGTPVPMATVLAVHEATAAATLDAFAAESDHFHPPATAPPAVALAPSA